MGCIYLAQGRDSWWMLVNAILNLRVPLKFGKFSTSLWPVSFSARTLLHELATCSSSSTHAQRKPCKIQNCRISQTLVFSSLRNIYFLLVPSRLHPFKFCSDSLAFWGCSRSNPWCLANV